MEKISRNSKLHHQVEATYNTFTAGGKKYVQINTYGSSDRKEKGVVSQTIQLSEDTINQLKGIIEHSF